MNKLIKLILVALLAQISINAWAGTATFVGPSTDENCAFDSIQLALDSGATTIHISTEIQYNENLVLPETNTQVVVKGGYSDCTEASFDPQLKATISGHLTSSPVLIILPSTNTKQIYLENLNIVNGSGIFFFPAGGINLPGSNDRLILSNTTVDLNEGELGGGIYIGSASGAPLSEQPILYMFDNTLVSNNTSLSDTFGGGGIYCEKGNIFLYSNSSIKRNTAEGSGGGAYLNECVLNDFTGESGENDPEQGIFDNKAKLHGGGIYANNNSRIQLGTAGSSKFFGSVINNLSDSDFDGTGDGGGIYVTNSNVNLLGSVLKGNRAGGNGGGIYAENDGTVYLQRQSNQCWTDYKCNQVIQNQAINGGGIYVTNGSDGFINSAYFDGNRADNGTALYVTSENSSISLRNATFFSNGNNGADGFNDNNVIMANNDSSISSIHNTFVNNRETVSSFRSQNNSSLTVQATIIESDTATSAIRIASSNPVAVDCVNTNLMPLTGTDVFNIFVSYVDKINGDLRLASNDNGAMDKCIDYGITTDSQGDFRPYDNQNVNNLRGPYDVGADEYIEQLIFLNGFESFK